MPKPPPVPQTVAAVDLGSNSFHLIVARPEDGNLVVIDRLREMVQLGAGLDADGNLTAEAEQRALACLEKFGQRLHALPAGSVRAVGTNTLRRARNSRRFLARAAAALGHPVEVIAGIEEARLIYDGVAHSLAGDGRRRLVMDIGGGSTEFIIGERFEPHYMESTYMGCVGISRSHFPNGLITPKAMRRAELAAAVELEPHRAQLLQLGWDDVIGSSGTIRAVERVVRDAGWSSDGITLSALHALRAAMIEAGHVDGLDFGGLAKRRQAVFPGGVAVLTASFESLGIERMRVSDGALREGLLYDLIGRFTDDDTRDLAIRNLARRFNVDDAQSERVRDTAVRLLEMATGFWDLPEASTQLLSRAAAVHEIGLGIAHSQYHKHGAYILEHADLLGFSRDEQLLLSVLIRAQRRKFPESAFRPLPEPRTTEVRRLAVLFRLAVLLHRSRSPAPLPAFRLGFSDGELELAFPEGWLADHPLTRADLEDEAHFLVGTGFQLTTT